MTTVEAIWMSCAEAVEKAGRGGQITERHGSDREDFTTYNVVRPYEGGVVLRQNDSRSVAFDHLYSDDTSESSADRWRVEATKDEIPTVEEFFRHTSVGTIVVAHGNNQSYVFNGVEPIPDDENGRSRIRLVSLRFGDFIFITEFDQPNVWSVRNMSATTVEMARLANTLAVTDERLIASLRREDEYAKQLRTLTRDFETVNLKINEYADENSMCSDYESRIFGWNEELTTKLVGRLRNWFVPVQSDLWENPYGEEMRICVEARSREDAKRIVENLSVSEVFGKLADQGYQLKSGDLEVTFNGNATM